MNCFWNTENILTNYGTLNLNNFICIIFFGISLELKNQIVSKFFPTKNAEISSQTNLDDCAELNS